MREKAYFSKRVHENGFVDKNAITFEIAENKIINDICSKFQKKKSQIKPM